MKPRLIGIHPSADLLHPGIREALTRLEPVQFADCPDIAQWREGGAVISLSGRAEMPRRLAQRGLHWLHVAAGAARDRSATGSGRIRFGNSPHLDERLRGRSLPHKPVPNVSAIRPEPGDEVLAWRDNDPVWIARPGALVCANTVSAPLPKLTGRERLSDYLNEEHFIQALPLLHFLRRVAGDAGWEKPPLRACLMFDDPNLHWPSYGFLPFQELALQAKTGGFHVAVATVPLDAWATHPRAVDLFRENSTSLSLLIHGNDHLRAELGRARPSEEQLRVIAQGLSRIARLENATGLHVARVMAPPHGAYTEVSLAAMLALGFEGACISRGSLRAWNPQRDWPATFGLEMAEMMQQLPVIHRFRLSESCEGHVVISAFLDRPIIPVGHHDSVSSGLELLSSVAHMINSLGNVHWMNPELMLRSNYLSVPEDSTLRVKPYSSRIQLTIPQDITEIMIEVPEDGGQRGGAWECALPLEASPPGCHEGRIAVKVTPGETIEFVSPQLGATDFHKVERPGFSPWALPRRILCEGRDRLGPFISAVGRKRRQSA
jgi:hypothetical protein